jgi:hypothetical protein
MAKRKDMLVHDVPKPIADALNADAQAQGISINAAAVTILAGHYGVVFAPSNAPYTRGLLLNLSIRGGDTLHRRIHIDAAKRGGTLRGVVLERLALHYGLEPEPIGRRPRRNSK